MTRKVRTSRYKKLGIVFDEKMGITLDKTNEAIIHCLEKNPEISLKNIPRELKVSGGPSISLPTVQRRVNKLIEVKVIRRCLSIDWAVAGYMVRYRVGILIDPKELRDKSIEDRQYDSQEGLADYIIKELAQGDPFKNRLLVDDVYILLGGRVDLAIDFYAKDDKTATQFIINALRNLPGIRDTVSAKLAYSTKHKWLSKNGDE